MHLILHISTATLTLALLLIVMPLGPALAHEGEPDPVDQHALTRMVTEGNGSEAFLHAFESGDKLTEASFTAARGVGARVGPGLRFSRIPRADLSAEGDWATHQPMREGGPNETSCIGCHHAPVDNGAGPISVNALIDPLHTGNPAHYLERNTLHLFGLGAVQRIAEEMTMALHALRDAARAEVCESGGRVTVPLEAKGIGFGTLSVTRIAGAPCETSVDTAAIQGVDADLIVRPFGWKGTAASIREFTRGAAHNELGMQAAELLGPGEDGDHDGVAEELSVGDLTALSMYMAALPRPSTTLELASLGLAEVSDEERAAIGRGEALFTEIGCAACHVPALTLEEPVFQEPSTVPAYRDAVFPGGQSPEKLGLSHIHAVAFDLRRDQPNNRVVGPDGSETHLGAFETDAEDRAIVRWYSDFKRHDLGPDLADPVDPFGFGATVWPTRSLAGVGSTGPWLHHGQATTLDEAIRRHGGEAGDTAKRYAGLDPSLRSDLVAFLESMVIYKAEE